MKVTIAILSLVAGCRSMLPANDDYTITVVDSGSCAQICADLTRLECPEGDTSPGGHPCTEFCSLALAVIKIDGDCLHSATTQSDARKCGIRCRN